MSLPLNTPPKSLCLLRLSALGDISHTLPIVRTIQSHWPETKITWLIGKLEHQLVCDIPEIEFIVFDKNSGWRAYHKLRQQMKGRHFDVLLHMQMSIRASIASRLISSPIRLGFDKARAKDMQWLFTNHKIAAKQKQHVIDSFFGFSEALGIEEHDYRWDMPIPAEAIQFANTQLPQDKHILVISPCSSMSYRNWTAERYAAICDYATNELGMHVVLCGGPSDIERQYGEKISSLSQQTPQNLIAKTSIKQLLAVLKKAKVIIAPDSGPAHLAVAVGTPIIGLYACTNPDRARPYDYPELVINKYPSAIKEKFGVTVDEISWGKRVRDDGTMEKITVKEVSAMLGQFMGHQSFTDQT